MLALVASATVSRRIPLLFSWATAPYLKSLVTGNQNKPKPTWGVEKSQKMKSSNLYQVPFLWFWRLGGLSPIQVPKKKLKSKQNQKSYQHFYHFTIPVIWQNILVVNSGSLNGDEIEDLQKMGFDFGRFVSDLQYWNYYKISKKLKKWSKISRPSTRSWTVGGLQSIIFFQNFTTSCSIDLPMML